MNRTPGTRTAPRAIPPARRPVVHSMALPDANRRKRDHLRIAAGPGVTHAISSGLAGLRLRHRALPEQDLADVSLDTVLLGRPLRAPLLVSAMTGGVREAAVVNERLARAAAEHGVAMTLGSGRALLDDPSLLSTYVGGAPDRRPPLLLANLGAAQLRGPDGPAAAARLVELLQADGLVVHLNAIQEAVQPEGEPRFAGVASQIAAVVERLAPLPVVAKEVGFGLDGADVALLRDAGVAAVDVAGAGGTNWALVEGGRDPRARAVAAAFADWGVSTVAALVAARAAAPGLPAIASGGLRDGVDAAKCLALGASAAGLARVLLIAAQADRAGEALGTIVAQLRIATWAAGAARTGDLGAGHLQEPPA
jgi:isopentenyl-diphosphate delta-isomerase